MKIHVLVANSLWAETPCVVDAWDEWSIDSNPTGWNEAVAKARKENGEIREAILTVPDGWLESIYDPTVTVARPAAPSPSSEEAVGEPLPIDHPDPYDTQ